MKKTTKINFYLTLFWGESWAPGTAVALTLSKNWKIWTIWGHLIVLDTQYLS